MGFRYRRSVKIGGLRINFSKSGIGYSYGVKGLRYTKTAKGKDRVTASIPGTGISYVAESGGRRRRRAKTAQQSVPQTQAPTKHYKMPPVLALLAVACGIGFIVYYISQERSVGLSIGSGIVMGGLSYLAICFLYGIIAGAVNSVTGKEIVKAIEDDSATQMHENSSVQAASDAETQSETFEVVGAFYCRTGIAKVMNPNPDWRKTCKTLVKEGKADSRIYRFYRTTKQAELAEETNNPHDPNAVMVKIDGEKVGYISAAEALHVKEILHQHVLMDATATITGGEYKTITPDAEMIKNQSGPFVTVNIHYQ